MDSNGLFIIDDCTTKVEQSSSFLSSPYLIHMKQ